MADKIDYKKDRRGRNRFPITHEKAVRDSNWVWLEEKLKGLVPPGGGVPYAKPSSGIPVTDMSEDIQKAIIAAKESVKREYDSQSPNGLGYLVLDKNKTFAEQVTDTNTIYEIRNDFNLGGATFSLPAKCVLVFEGGKLSNGTLEGDNSVIDASAEQIFNTNLTLSGTWNINKAFPEWYGAVADGVTDCTSAIQKLDGFPIYFSGGTYIISNVILHINTLLIGCGIDKTTLKQKPNSVDDMIILQDWRGGCMRDMTIQGDATATLSGNGFQTALVKMRSEKRTPNNTYNYYASIDNVLINGAGASNTFNGLSLLGANQVDNGFVCAANWVFHISNIWIRHCGGYGLYDAGSDNLFNTLDIGSCGFAHIYEKGSSNMWVNAKLDGNFLSTLTGTAEEIYNMTDKGALLIVDSGGIVNMLNFDLQDSKYCGCKLINCSKSHLEISSNFIGSSALVSDIPFSKNFYLDAVTYSVLRFTIIPYTNQVSCIGFNKISRVSLNDITIVGTVTDSDREVIRHFQINNIVNLPNSMTDSYRRRTANLLSNPMVLNNIFYKNIVDDTEKAYFTYSNAVQESSSPIYANTPYYVFDNTETNVLRGIINKYPQKSLRKDSLYLVVFVARIDSIPTNSGDKWPFANISYNAKSPNIFLTKRTRATTPEVGDVYIEATLFSYALNDEVTAEYYSPGIAVYLAGASNGKFSVGNFCLYQLTDVDFQNWLDFDILTTIPANAPYTTDLILKVSAQKGFNSLAMDSVSRAALFSTGTRNNRGRLVFDTTFQELVYFDGAEWISATTGLKLAKRRGTFSEKPTFTTGTNAGFQYYDETNHRVILWNGTDWVNMDGTALS